MERKLCHVERNGSSVDRAAGPSAQLAFGKESGQGLASASSERRATFSGARCGPRRGGVLPKKSTADVARGAKPTVGCTAALGIATQVRNNPRNCHRFPAS